MTMNLGKAAAQTGTEGFHHMYRLGCLDLP